MRSAHQVRQQFSGEACLETRRRFDSFCASSFTAGFFRMRLGGWRWGRACLNGPTISSKPAGTPTSPPLDMVRRKGEEGV